ncbi:MAG: hypothetical protein WCP63_04235, partial [Cyanobium sp. ELA712]
AQQQGGPQQSSGSHGERQGTERRGGHGEALDTVTLSAAAAAAGPSAWNQGQSSSVVARASRPTRRA